MQKNGKTPTELKEKKEVTVGELAGKDVRKMEIFRRFGIDFCCGGGQTLAEACQRVGITEGELHAALSLAELDAVKPSQEYASWDLVKLADHIVDFHHRYVRETLPVLLEYTRKVAEHHGAHHPELIELEVKIRAEALDLVSHMDAEERILFPAIRKIVVKDSGDSLAIHDGSVKKAIKRMLKDHASSGESLEGFRKVTQNYTAPEDACNSYRFLYEKLREFDADLQKHIHLENNILFPKTLAISGSTAN